MKVSQTVFTIRSAFAEIASIVIGVLIALAVNEWNENRVHTARANEAIQNIVNELDSNIKFIGIVNKNNKAVINLLENENSVPADESKDQQFVPGLQIQDTAWKTLQSTGVAEYIDYATLYQISNIYALQEIYKNLGYQLIQNIANHRSLIAAINQSKPESRDGKSFDGEFFLSDMTLIAQVEQALLDSYKKTLAQLKKPM
ncbi:hypothetical protein AAD001_16575 [Colwelliaceae bacterium 6471]